MEKVTCTTCGKENPVTYKYCFGCGYELPKIKAQISEDLPPSKPNKTKFNKSTLLGIVVGAVFFALGYFVVQQLLFKTPILDKAMMAMASEINKSCPLMVDAETRLDNSAALTNNTFQYNYTLINVEINTVNPEEMKGYMEPYLIDQVKNNKQMELFRKLKTTINYSYKDKTGKFLFMVSVTPDKYE
ncbi:MAG TPA: hypothetical protein VFG54_20980 [Prolixibacteraceae bacterium]|nr:hypothetical protein [Prolixibacteraceae bacterium]